MGAVPTYDHVQVNSYEGAKGHNLPADHPGSPGTMEPTSSAPGPGRAGFSWGGSKQGRGQD